MLVMFGDILPFLEDSSDLGPATCTKMLAILQNQQKKAALMVEMAITVDAGKIFVQTTYNLEGNEPLEQNLQKWASALRKVLLLQPSFASAERVFPSF